MGFSAIRCVGLTKASAQVTLAASAFNLRRGHAKPGLIRPGVRLTARRRAQSHPMTDLKAQALCQNGPAPITRAAARRFAPFIPSAGMVKLAMFYQRLKQCSTYLGGRKHRQSTYEENLALAMEFAPQLVSRPTRRSPRGARRQ